MIYHGCLWGYPYHPCLSPSPVGYLLTDTIRKATFHLPFHHKILETGVEYTNPVPAFFVSVSLLFEGIDELLEQIVGTARLCCPCLLFLPLCCERTAHEQCSVQAASAESLLLRSPCAKPKHTNLFKSSNHHAKCRQHRRMDFFFFSFKII